MALNQQNKPNQSANNNVPVWLKGAYSNSGNTRKTTTPTRGTHRKSNPVNMSKSDALKNKAAVMDRTANRDDQYNGPNFAAPSNADYNPTAPAWMSNIIKKMRENAQGGGAFNYGNRNPVQSNKDLYPNSPQPTGYGQTNPNPEVTKGHLRGTNQPFVVGQDAINQSFGSPYDSYKGYRFPQLNLQPVNPRTVVAGPGTLDMSLWDQPASSVFGSSYGGNWRGGGGGGGWQDWGSNDYPAWVKTLMGLNSWNIK